MERDGKGGNEKGENEMRGKRGVDGGMGKLRPLFLKFPDLPLDVVCYDYTN